MNKQRYDRDLSLPSNLGKEYSSSIYSLINQKTTNVENIPLNPNLLIFADPTLEKKYWMSLFSSAESQKRPSSEFKTNLLLFYLFFSLYTLSTLAQDLIFYLNNELCVPQYVFKTSFLFFNLSLSLAILNVLFKSNFALKNSIKIFNTLGLLIISSIILTDSRILSKIVTQHSQIDTRSTTMLIITFTSLINRLLFDSFFSVLFLSIFSITSLTIALVLTSTSLSCLYELFLLLISLIYICITTYRQSLVNREVFYRTEQKAKNLADVSCVTELNDPSNPVYINTEIELLVLLCEKIKKSIKVACSLIMFKDIKSKLKLALTELDNLKKRITGDIFRQAVIIENNELMDEQDKAFISQMFMQISHKTLTSSISKGTTLKDLTETSPLLFNKYGIKNFDKVLDSIGVDWNLDIWFIHQSTGHSIFILAKCLCIKWGVCEEFRIEEEIFDNFFQTVEKKYHHNPYHNACHAADVLHNFVYFCTFGDLLNKITHLETLGCIIANVCHDIGHPALTNRFLIHNKDELSIQYNDISVLENMHAYTTFNLLNKTSCNVLQSLTEDEWFKIRKFIIQLILDTDMSRHFEILGRFRVKMLEPASFDFEDIEHRALVFSMCIKCADLGHSAKCLELHQKWTALICEEFFRQGDLEKERKQDISMYCDRFNTDIPKSQAGFIKNICLPLYDSWCVFINSDVVNTACMENLKSNFIHWSSKFKSEKEKERESFELK